MLCASAHAAVDAKSTSSRLSDEAFALLNSVSQNHGSPSPLLGPVGVFAGDAQKLSEAIAAGDRVGAAATLTSLKADAAAVEKAAGSGGLDKPKWSAIKTNLAALAPMVPVAPANSTPANVTPANVTDNKPSAPSTSGSAAIAPAEPAPVGNPSDLAVKVESAQMVGNDVLRVQGYLRGRGISSAGIYTGDELRAPLNLKPDAGPRMVQFKLNISDPVPGAVIRIYGPDGRSAEAPISGAAETASPAAEAASPIAEAGASAPSLSPSEETASTGDDLGSASTPPEPGASADNTEEIPAAAPPISGPKRRMVSHLRANGPSDISIQIAALSMVDPGLREYRIAGQISGSNLKRAGIYIDDRLVQEIPLNAGSGFHTSTFAQSFDAIGSEAAIRVYRSRHDYTESSIDLATAGVGTAMAGVPPGAVAINPATVNPMTANPTISNMISNPMTANAYDAESNPDQLAVQISSVQPASSTLYVVTGMISGRNIASAGLYQNGGLIQTINVGGSGISGGLSGLISGFIPGTSRQISFAGRFNPMQGLATVRVYDRSGMMTEQPVIVAGTPYAPNPYGYGAVNPYVRNPYTGAYTGVTPGVSMAPGIGVSPGFGMTPGVGVSTGRGIPAGPGSVP